MRKLFILLFIFNIYNNLFSQRYDYQWMFGYGDGKTVRLGIGILDFNGGEIDVSFVREAADYELGYTGSTISDKYGSIKYFTNNCDVRDANWHIISGEEVITPTGNSHGCTWNSEHRYSAYQSAVFLPDLTDNTITYLIHKDITIDYEAQDIFSNNMYFSVIKQDTTRHEYNDIYIDTTRNQMASRLTACPNRDKDKWWVLMPGNHSNVFRKYLIGKDTVIVKDTQSIGMKIPELGLGLGQAQYSPDGSMLGINSERFGILLYDFDNKTGELSNFRQIPYPNSINRAEGLCFSPNNRFIYVSTSEHVYQIDLDNDNEIYHVGKFRSIDEEHNWPVGLGMMFSGPDCRIYVSPGSTTYYLHVILNPDEKAAACQFAERAVELPVTIPHDIPNLPQYRYLEGCDTSIVFPFETSVLDEVLDEIEFKIYPNPTSDYIELILTKMDRWQRWQILDLSGHLIKGGKYKDMQKINVSDLRSGMYFLRLTDRKGELRVGKFVVE